MRTDDPMARDAVVSIFFQRPSSSMLYFTWETGKFFAIDVDGNPRRDFYIQSATLNGKELLRAWLRDAEIRGGGTLHLVVGSVSNRQWGISHLPLLIFESF
jgi:putative alpha-1,2-mannosidase